MSHSMPVKADELLAVCGENIRDRVAVRDAAGARTMRKTVAAFNALHGTDLTESQGWQFMEVLKIARSSQGGHCLDDYIDGAGYAALAGEAAAAEELDRRFEPRECHLGDPVQGVR